MLIPDRKPDSVRTSPVAREGITVERDGLSYYTATFYHRGQGIVSFTCPDPDEAARELNYWAFCHGLVSSLPGLEH